MKDEDLELLMLGQSALLRTLGEVLPRNDKAEHMRAMALEDISTRMLRRAHELGGGRDQYAGDIDV